MKIIIIGRGNVACNLDKAFRDNGANVCMVSSREGLDSLPEADVYIYAVKDDVLPEVVNHVHVSKRALHLHTSGTMPISVFGTDKPHAGILYFFQSFSKTHLLDSMAHVPVFIEGRDIDDVSAIYALAQIVTDSIYEANQHDRERLHVAGVFANNFTNEMYAIASDLLRDTHIPFQALLPLIDQTATKVHTLTPRDAQTGPAKRDDQEVMKHHVDIIQNPEWKQLYQLISLLIQERSAQ